MKKAMESPTIEIPDTITTIEEFDISLDLE